MLSDKQIRRYSRHILLHDIGGVGQEKLLSSTVELTLSPDAIGSWAALPLLVAGGIGSIRIVSDPRQTIGDTEIRFCTALSAGHLGSPYGGIVKVFENINPYCKLAFFPQAKPSGSTLPFVVSDTGKKPQEVGAIASATAFQLLHKVATA